MKKFIYLIPIILAALLLTACNNDDNITPTSELDGTWKMVSFEIDAETLVEAQFNGYNESFTTIDNAEAVNTDYTITFDGGQYTGEGSYDLQHISTFDGYVQSFTTSYDNILQTGSYSVDEDANTVTAEGAFVQATANGTNIAETGGEPHTTSYTINSNGQLLFSQNEDFEVVAGNGAGGTTTTTSTIVALAVWEKE